MRIFEIAYTRDRAVRGKKLLELEQERHYEEAIMRMPDEPDVCKMFGCGKHLSDQEKLFGNYCINHKPISHGQE